LYAASGTKTDAQSYTFKKEVPPPKPTGLKISFKKPADWNTPSLYYYEAKPTSVAPVVWATAPQMKEVGDGWFSYTIEGAESATVIFKDGVRQIPGQNQPGAVRTSESWHDGTTWLTKSPFPDSPADSGSTDLDQIIDDILNEDTGTTDPGTDTSPVADNIPFDLDTTSQTTTSISLNWKAPAAAGAKSFTIYRDGKKVGSSTKTTYTDSKLTADTDYEYAVSLVDGTGKESAKSETVVVTTLPDGSSSTGSDDTPSTTTPKPVTPKPVTPKPVTPKPVTPKPVTPTPAPPVEDEIEVPIVKDEIDDAKFKTVKLTTTNIKSAIDAGKDGRFTYSVSGQDENVKVEIPYEVLALIAEQSEEAILSLERGGTAYDLPVTALDYPSISSDLSISEENLTFVVYFEKVETDVRDAFEKALAKAKAKPASDLMRFALVATDGADNELLIKEVEGSFIARSMQLAADVDTSNLTAVMYEPETGKTSFLPAQFVEAGDAKMAVVFATHHSLVGLAEASKTFADTENHWARDDISAMASKLVVNGATATTFNPDAFITRAEFASILVRALGLREDKSAAQFRDIKSTDWFAGTVGAAVKNGLVTGVSENEYKPLANITRQEMSIMLSRATKLVNKPVNISDEETFDLIGQFSDMNQIASWAQMAVAEALQAGIIKGKTEKTFVPKAKANRAEATVMLKRLLQYASFIN
jgi:hypothetical protein